MDQLPPSVAKALTLARLGRTRQAAALIAAEPGLSPDDRRRAVDILGRVAAWRRRSVRGGMLGLITAVAGTVVLIRVFANQGVDLSVFAFVAGPIVAIAGWVAGWMLAGGSHRVE